MRLKPFILYIVAMISTDSLMGFCLDFVYESQISRESDIRRARNICAGHREQQGLRYNILTFVAVAYGGACYDERRPASTTVFGLFTHND